MNNSYDERFDTWQYLFNRPILEGQVGYQFGIKFEIRSKEQGHNEPHLHASYGGQEISISLLDGFKVLAGNLPPKNQAVARQWVADNIDMLRTKWSCLHRTIYFK